MTSTIHPHFLETLTILLITLQADFDRYLESLHSLVAMHFQLTHKCFRITGRTRTGEEIETLVLRMAKENRAWGYRRIQGAISNLGHKLARSTIADVLRRHGIEPAPERSRKTTWKEFLTRHWELIVAADFFTVEVWTARGLKRFLVLFFIDLSTRKVEIAGIASSANGLWMSQIGKNVTDAMNGILTGKRYLEVLQSLQSEHTNDLDVSSSRGHWHFEESRNEQGVFQDVVFR
jgi:putative transposase